MADQELADAILNGIDAIEGGLNETSRLYDGGTRLYGIIE